MVWPRILPSLRIGIQWRMGLFFAGVYSSDNAPEFADAFDYGKFGIVSLGRDWAESFGYDKALIRFDIMLQDDDEMKYKDWDGL